MNADRRRTTGGDGRPTGSDGPDAVGHRVGPPHPAGRGASRPPGRGLRDLGSPGGGARVAALVLVGGRVAGRGPRRPGHAFDVDRLSDGPGPRADHPRPAGWGARGLDGEPPVEGGASHDPGRCHRDGRRCDRRSRRPPRHAHRRPVRPAARRAPRRPGAPHRTGQAAAPTRPRHRATRMVRESGRPRLVALLGRRLVDRPHLSDGLRRAEPRPGPTAPTAATESVRSADGPAWSAGISADPPAPVPAAHGAGEPRRDHQIGG